MNHDALQSAWKAAETAPLAPQVPQVTKPATGRWWSWIDGIVERVGDRLNPILVKEARQALKSRQFTVTFGLLLICAWGWSLITVGFQAERLSYGGAAVGAFMGYFFILVLPVVVMVPFAAFQSLSAERDEGTFDLLTITALSARQIVRGKLASAVLQMLVYFSALSPCIAFTYLLRGLDILTVVVVIGLTFLISLTLCAFGLMLATLTGVSHLRVMLSGLFVVGLMFAFFGWYAFVTNVFIQFGVGFDEPYFWVTILCITTAAVSFIVLFLAAAAAQMSFASDNRSTRLRVIMLVQQALFIGWITYFYLTIRQDDILYFGATVITIYWALFGALLSSEVAELSPRVKRALPATALGRVLLTWFNPGSGTGYVFAISNLCVALTTFWVVDRVGQDGLSASRGWTTVAILMACYVVAYLGIGRLLILVFRHYYRVNLLVGFLLQAVLVGLGGIVPMTLQFSMYRIYGEEYTYLQIANWGWTLAEVGDNSLPPNISSFVIMMVLFWVALPVALTNIGFAAKEVAQTREVTPQRVQEEERQRKSRQ